MLVDLAKEQGVILNLVGVLLPDAGNGVNLTKTINPRRPENRNSTLTFSRWTSGKVSETVTGWVWC